MSDHFDIPLSDHADLSHTGLEYGHPGTSDHIDAHSHVEQYAPYVHEEDLNHDGRVDVVSADTDHDGTDDAWQYDQNNDGKIDMVGYDLNHDGSIDQKEYDHNEDGRIDEVRLDMNHDYKPEMRQVDTNNDGVLDQLDRDSDGDGTLDQHDHISTVHTMPHWGPDAHYGSVYPRRERRRGWARPPQLFLQRPAS